MRTGGNELLYLVFGQGLGCASFTFDSNHTFLFWLRFGNPMQKRLVCSSTRNGELVQRQLWNRPQAGVKRIEALNRPDGLVNGGVGAPGLLLLDGNDRRV